MNEALRSELLSMQEEDTRVRDEMAADGTLYDGYHPRMEAVHLGNAAKLRRIVAVHGWPGASLVGTDGAQAAWLVVQHAISEPDFCRECLPLLWAAAHDRQAEAWQAAMLEDCIRRFEGKPQRFGSQLDPDEDGLPRPYWIDDPEGVDARRREVGLEPLSEMLAQRGREPLPPDRQRYEREYTEWLKKVGWR